MHISLQRSAAGSACRSRSKSPDEVTAHFGFYGPIRCSATPIYSSPTTCVDGSLIPPRSDAQVGRIVTVSKDHEPSNGAPW
jgi:hypothetical protein